MIRIPARPRRQTGVVLIMLLAVLAMGASWFLVSRMNAISGDFTAARRNHNAAVLAEAKQALIGYTAMRAADTAEQEPGALPCPEAAGSVGGVTEGQAASNLGLPAIGRLPWKTLGVDQLRDAATEPLWYVVADGWGRCGTSGATVINSNCTSLSSGMACSTNQMTLAGRPGAIVALIIAPGVATTGQVRSAPAAGIDPADYVECYNTTAPGAFAIPACASNDQVVGITAEELIAALEPVIAKRIDQQIAPVLRAVYPGDGSWGFSGGAPVYPFPAPFADPSTSAMQGSSALPAPKRGLLPLSHAETSPGSGTLCTVSAADPRCSPSFVAWSGAASLSSPSTYNESCTVAATQIDCTFNYQVCVVPLLCGTTSTIPFSVSATASNVGMALRRINSAVPMTNVAGAGRSVTATLDASGTASVSITGTANVSSTSSGLLLDLACGLVGGLLPFLFDCNPASISIPIAVFADHPLLDTSAATTGWFFRNRWHELTYYAVADGHTAAILPAAPACTTGTDCLSVANAIPSGGQRAVLILAGRSVNGSPRPSGNPADYLEFGNASGAFEIQPVRLKTPDAALIKAPFNDRVVVVGAN